MTEPARMDGPQVAHVERAITARLKEPAGVKPTEKLLHLRQTVWRQGFSSEHFHLMDKLFFSSAVELMEQFREELLILFRTAKVAAAA